MNQRKNIQTVRNRYKENQKEKKDYISFIALIISFCSLIMTLYFNKEDLKVIYEQTEVMKTQTEIQNQERMPKFEIEKHDELDSIKYVFKNKGGYVSNFNLEIIDRLKFNTELYDAGIFDRMSFRPYLSNNNEWTIQTKKDLELFKIGYDNLLVNNETSAKDNMIFANRYFQIKYIDYTNSNRKIYYEETNDGEIIYKENAEEEIACDNLNDTSYYRVMVSYEFGDNALNWSKEKYTDQVVQMTYNWLMRMLKEGMPESPNWTCEKRKDSFFF